jgi:hypothetical protein
VFGHAAEDVRLADFLLSVSSAAEPDSAMKSGDWLQMQRLMALVHKLRITSAQAQARERLAVASKPGTARDDDVPVLPDVPTHKQR